MTAAPLPATHSPSRSTSKSSAPQAAWEIDEAHGARVRLDHAIGGAISDPVEFLATVELDGGLTIGPVKIVLAEPSRVAIDWPDRLIGSEIAGGHREVRRSTRARQQIHDAFVRHPVFGDLGSERP